MKKFLTMVLLTIMLVSITCSALAIGDDHTFEIYVQCTNADTYTDARDGYRKAVDDGAIYVKHWVMGGSDEYTNHFRGRKSLSNGESGRTNCGSKWCTVNMNVPIQSNSIKKDSYYYSVSGRGNTNHYNYDGVSNVTLHGHMYI